MIQRKKRKKKMWIAAIKAHLHPKGIVKCLLNMELQPEVGSLSLAQRLETMLIICTEQTNRI